MNYERWFAVESGDRVLKLIKCPDALTAVMVFDLNEVLRSHGFLMKSENMVIVTEPIEK